MLEITNKKSNRVHLMSSSEALNFFRVNDITNYTIIDLKEKANQKRNRMLDIAAGVGLIVAAMLMTILYVNTNY